MQVAEARRIDAPRWLNLRTVLGLALFLISLLSGSVVLRSGERGVTVWAAARDLAEGTAVDAGDFELVTVDLPPGQLALYLGESASLGGSSLLRPLRRGELVAADWVTDRSTVSNRSIAVPLTSDHAVGGALRPGDRVDVFATLRSAGGRSRTTLLVQDAEVESLLRSEGLMTGDDSFAGITLSVPPDQAARIAFAVRTADVDVVRVDGAFVTATVSSVTAGDL